MTRTYARQSGHVSPLMAQIPQPNELAEEDFRCLPPRVRILFELLGADRAVAFIERFQNRDLYMPDKASEGHEISKITGVEAMQELIDHFGRRCRMGQVPTLDSVHRVLRDRLICSVTSSTIPDLANQLGLTARRCWQIRAKYAAELIDQELEESGRLN